VTDDWLGGLAARRRAGSGEGVTSICSAHPLVIEAALRWAAGGPVLIEATCNQVNQEGGYTGMMPRDFRVFVEAIAARASTDPGNIVLGGDHLGPNPWRHLPADDAMARAEAMVAAYVEAGFSKIHLDASMPCRGDPASLGDAVVAQRAARLARAAEESASRAGKPLPLYVIGTEVPAPGGAAETHRIDVTRPEAAKATLAAHGEAFARAGIAEAFGRVIALVVQPGVEFGQEHIDVYRSQAAAGLIRMLADTPSIVFEAHSTDYQPPGMLAALVADGFAILKVGPALTFALREALYGLDRIAAELDPNWSRHSLEVAMERLMLADPRHWRGYYRGGEAKERQLRHTSYSDRIRYYWPAPEAAAAVDALLAALARTAIPFALIGRFLPRIQEAVRDGRIAPTPHDLIVGYVSAVLAGYPRAGNQAGEQKP
jgi:D-tagatose-bisphosphate aldolase class II non-catalytic subunit